MSAVEENTYDTFLGKAPEKFTYLEKECDGYFMYLHLMCYTKPLALYYIKNYSSS